MQNRKKLLILPDSHAHPDFDNLRFRALGNFIVTEKPDIIVNIGDFADMPSLSSYDIGKASFEGRRYKDDIAVVIDAQQELFAPVKAERRKTHRTYAPRLEYFGGNHDWGRIELAAEMDPKLKGVIGVQDLKLAEFGWRTHPFKEIGVIEGIAFSHYFASGVAGRPISGESVGRSLCTKLHVSAVAGHNHCLDHAERTTATGTKIFGLSCGSYVHPEMIADWNRGTYQMWWRGVVVLNDCDGKGYYDELRAITQRKLMREYL